MDVPISGSVLPADLLAQIRGVNQQTESCGIEGGEPRTPTSTSSPYNDASEELEREEAMASKVLSEQTSRPNLGGAGVNPFSPSRISSVNDSVSTYDVEFSLGDIVAIVLGYARKKMSVGVDIAVKLATNNPIFVALRNLPPEVRHAPRDIVRMLKRHIRERAMEAREMRALADSGRPQAEVASAPSESSAADKEKLEALERDIRELRALLLQVNPASLPPAPASSATPTGSIPKPPPLPPRAGGAPTPMLPPAPAPCEKSASEIASNSIYTTPTMAAPTPVFSAAANQIKHAIRAPTVAEGAQGTASLDDFKNAREPARKAHGIDVSDLHMGKTSLRKTTGRKSLGGTPLREKNSNSDPLMDSLNQTIMSVRKLQMGGEQSDDDFPSSPKAVSPVKKTGSVLHRRGSSGGGYGMPQMVLPMNSAHKENQN